MNVATADLPIASSSANAGSGGSFGRIASPGGSLTQEASLGATDMSGASDSNSNKGTGSGSFRSNWQAMLASMDGSTGDEASAISKGISSAARPGGLGNSALTWKGSDSATAASSSSALIRANQAASLSSADILKRIQQLASTKSTLGSAAGDATGPHPSAVSSRASGIASSKSSRGAGTSETSKPATVSSDAFAGISLLAAGLAAGNTPQPIQAAAHRIGAVSAEAASGTGKPALVDGSALPVHPLAVSAGDSQAITQPGSLLQGDAVADSSNAGAAALAAKAPSHSFSASEGSIAGGMSGGLEPLTATTSAIDSDSAAISAGTSSPAEASSASSPSAGRRSGAGSGASSASSARSVQSVQRTSNEGSAARVGSQGGGFAQGSPASSAGGSNPLPLAAPGAGSGSAIGSTSGSTSGSGNGSSGGTAAPSARETFAALDGDTPAGGFNWVHTGTNRAEAGFEDPSLGWVGVRADLGGGSVHASLVPGSAEAAQALGSHLVGLNEYLAERHPAVATVTVAGHESDGAGTHTPSGGGSELGGHAGSQSSGQQNSAGNSGEAWKPAVTNPVSSTGRETVQNLSSSLASPAAIHGAETSGRSRGSYISVMA